MILLKFKKLIKNLVKASVPENIQNYIKTLIYPYHNKSFSQEGEDRILLRIFERKDKGFYIDIGAHHPYRFSNTYLFYRRGWRGINIDANPESIKLFNKYRPRDVNLNFGVGLKESMTYYMFEEPAVNTFDKKIAIQRQNLDGYRMIGQKVIETYTLSDILDEYLPSNQLIDFMNVDCEGMDFDVLKSNDWTKYRPDVLLVEILNANNFYEILSHPISNYLSQRSYQLFAKTFNTVFFLESEFLKSILL